VEASADELANLDCFCGCGVDLATHRRGTRFSDPSHRERLRRASQRFWRGYGQVRRSVTARSDEAKRERA
jgi:hypothetical protein